VIIPIAVLTDFAPWVKSGGDWYNSFTTTFLLLSPTTIASQLEAQLPGFVKKYYSKGAKERKLELLPFQEFHKAQVDNSTYVYGLGCVAVFLLLVACINFTNLSIATSLTRIREVAIRKTLGSSRRQLIFQFLAEACIMSMLALFIGVMLTNMVLPALNTLLDMNLQIHSWQRPLHMLLLLMLAMGIGLLAGLYPSLFLSALRPANALKGKISQQPGSLKIRNGLVVVQFAIAVFLTTGSLLVYQQIQFMKQADLRFDQENILVVDLNLGYKNETSAKSQINFILNELRNKPEIASFSTSKNIPGRYWNNYNSFSPDGKSQEPVSLRMTDVDEGYMTTYGIKLLEGRNFSLRTATDTTQAVMINQAAMNALGWQSAVGKKLYDQGSDQVWEVVGVMDDFHYQSLQGKVEPLIHFFTGPSRIENNNFLSIKIKPQDASSLIYDLKEKWQQVPSRKEFTYYFVDEEFNKQYLNVERSLSLITFFTAVTILIACSGIFALTSLSTQVRSKEIGVRKVLGAGVITIVGLFFKDYLKLVLRAILIACPLVYYAVHLWLQSFAYQIAISPWIFVASSVITILIALLTISYQTIKAAIANPVKSLRNE
jgi:putative ABC transport system permease protein